MRCFSRVRTVLPSNFGCQYAGHVAGDMQGEQTADHLKGSYLKLLFDGCLDRWASVWTTVRTEQGVCQLL